MIRTPALGIASLCLAGATLLGSQHQPARQRAESVELDAVVADNDERPVQGLRAEEFRIKEDGRPVALKNFAEISAAGIAGEADSRSLVLLLDDTSMNPTATQIVQHIARLFVDRMRPADHLSVVRLRHRNDEPVGDRKEMLARIDDYRSGSYPLLDDTHETWLGTLARLSRGLPRPVHRRTIVVGIGSPGLFDIYLPVPEETLVWPFWLDALSESADASVEVCVVDPRGVSLRSDLGYGLVDETGGAVFMRSNNFARAVDAVWLEASHYYRLGYVPTARARDLHTINVAVTRPGLHVRARRSRGD